MHRDLKPSNNLVAYPKQCRVIDFGLGQYIEQKLESSRLTKTGQGVAGDHFTPPEMLSDPKLIDPRCDVYSIGAVWYYVVTNTIAAGADVGSRLHAVADLSKAHINIILKCLGGIDERFQACAELLAAIAQPEHLAKTFQPQELTCRYLGGDPRFPVQWRGVAKLDPQEGIHFEVTESFSYNEYDTAEPDIHFAWRKEDVKAAYHDVGAVSTVEVRDPEDIMPKGFVLKFECDSEYHAKLFVARCQDFFDAIPF